MIKAMILAFQFLTRFKINVNVDMNDNIVRRSIGFYPFVGFVISSILLAVAYALIYLEVNFFVIAFVQLLCWVGITGAMHIDGVADTADGFLSNRSSERIQQIMRDSTIGVFGVVAVILLLLGKYIGLAILLNKNPLYILFIPMVGRFSATVCIASKPLASGSVMGDVLHRSKPRISILVNALLISAFALYVNKYMILILPVAVMCEEILSYKSNSLIGGVTGDIYGASVEIAELACLLLIGELI